MMRAPLLKVPQTGKRRKDTKFMGTIEKDPEYLEFLAELEQEPEPPKTAEQLMAARDAEEAKAKEQAEQEVTPLVAFMRKKRDEKERRQKVRWLPETPRGSPAWAEQCLVDCAMTLALARACRIRKTARRSGKRRRRQSAKRSASERHKSGTALSAVRRAAKRRRRDADAADER